MILYLAICLFYFIIFYYILLYYIIFYYIILYYFILNYIILYFIMLCYILLYYTMLYYIYYIVLYYIMLCYFVFFDIILWFCIILFYIKCIHFNLYMYIYIYCILYYLRKDFLDTSPALETRNCLAHAVGPRWFQFCRLRLATVLTTTRSTHMSWTWKGQGRLERCQRGDFTGFRGGFDPEPTWFRQSEDRLHKFIMW